MQDRASSRELQTCREALREVKVQRGVLSAQLQCVETLGQTSPDHLSVAEASAVVKTACLKAEKRRGAAVSVLIFHDVRFVGLIVFFLGVTINIDVWLVSLPHMLGICTFRCCRRYNEAVQN